jgi:hypothetical protein
VKAIFKCDDLVVKLKYTKTISLPVVLREFETWSLTQREAEGVCENI